MIFQTYLWFPDSSYFQNKYTLTLSALSDLTPDCNMFLACAYVAVIISRTRMHWILIQESSTYVENNCLWEFVLQKKNNSVLFVWLLTRDIFLWYNFAIDCHDKIRFPYFVSQIRVNWKH